MSAAPVGPASGTTPERVRIDSRRRWFPDLAELYRYRQLVFLLGRRDITVRVRQTALGTIWIILGPIVSAGLFSFVFGKIAGLPSGGVSYFVFSYAALVGWNLYAGALAGASSSLTANAALVTKIYFPRLVVPLSTMASVLLNLVISLGVMFVLLVIAGIGLTSHLLLLPLWLLLAGALAMGLALALTSVSVFYRDINYLTPLLTQLLLYLSPVAYSVEAVPANLRNLYLLNPLASIIEGCRWSLLGQAYLPPTWAIVYSVVVTVVVLVGGLMVFARMEGGFADVV